MALFVQIKEMFIWFCLFSELSIVRNYVNLHECTIYERKAFIADFHQV